MKASTQAPTRALLRIPATLLLHPDLPAPAKLVWMVSRLLPTAQAMSTTRLAATSGLSRPAVLRALAALRAAGWDPAQTGTSPGHSVPVPAPLLQDHGLGIAARVLYGIPSPGSPGASTPWQKRKGAWTLPNTAAKRSCGSIFPC